MNGTVLLLLTGILFFLAIGGAAFALAGGKSARAQKRMASVSGQQAAEAGGRNAPDANQQRRKNVSALLKNLEKQQAEKKQRPTLRHRIEQAGLSITPYSFYLLSATLALAVAAVCMLFNLPFLATAGIAFTAGIGLPRWVLSFLKARREKKFTNEFANAIDIIVRSVKSGLPTTEALKIVAREIPEPVSGEFERLVEGLKVGVTMDQGLKRMYERMPTSDVSFFGIVMSIQQKSGGNLSEALSNLAGVLRDRKRLQGKIKSMSSEAKASAAIIGSLPPGVMLLVWLSTPAYIETLFNERLGILMLAGCAVWMATGIFVMKKMVSFKH